MLDCLHIRACGVHLQLSKANNERENSMAHFINFSVNKGIQITTHRNNGSYGEITEFVDDYQDGIDCCCPLDGAKHALEDGAMWQGSSVTIETLEDIHAAITAFEDNEQIAQEMIEIEHLGYDY